ncbi:MAG: class A beta-lactamase-related serine hydrolase [Bacteroidetes bacterium]|nr:class A beta-lactamase-related serine hydrolase [Bacteroidota bacterium]
MKNTRFFVFVLISAGLFTGCTGSQPASTPKPGGVWTQTTEAVADTVPPAAVQTIEQKIAAIADQYQVRVGVMARNLKSGRQISINSRERIPVTSMIKVPVVAAWLNAAETGLVKKDARISILPKDKVSGSGELQFLEGSYPFLASDLAALAIISSDNIATNLIIDQLGKDVPSATGYVNKTLAGWGLTDTRLLNKFLRYDTKQATEESKNFGVAYSTAADLTAFAEKLYQGEIVSPDASSQILTWMRNANDDTMAPRFMPIDSPGFTLAHRSGGTFKLKGDFGLIEYQGQAVSFAVICENQTDDKKTIENNGIVATGIIIKMLFDELTR